MSNYWLIEAIKIATLFCSAYLLGLWVIKRGIKVNYTRKIFHFIFFFFPIYLTAQFPFDASIFTTLLSGVIFLLCTLAMIEPVRKRSVFIATAFTAIDRPEDRPYTLLWISTQLLTTYLVLVIMLAWLDSYDRLPLIYITVLIAGIGDGLAEPVGVRFGKHHYQVSALFTDRKYTRSLEGSLCVFISAILSILLLHDQLNTVELSLALLIIPITMTLAEALSPHTWDGPLLYLTGGVSTVAVVELSSIAMTL